MPLVTVTRRLRFNAAHRLHNPALSAEENRTLFGRDNNPHGHGHNYVVEVLVGGEVEPETGMVVNMATLDETVQQTVLKRFDHTNLNFDPLFVNQVPTTENLTKVVFDVLKEALPAGELEYVRVEETENNFFQYQGQ